MTTTEVQMTLREAREWAGMPREKVAPLLGVSVRTLIRLEEKNTTQRYRAAQLAEIYGVPVSILTFEARTAR